MQDELQKATITIASVAMEQGKYKLKDTNNRTYSLWMTKQNGEETKAYQAFKQLPNNGLEQTIDIMYNEKMVEGYQYPFKNIAGLRPSAGEPQISPEVPTNQPQARPMPVQPQKEEPNWDEINWGKCRTLFLAQGYRMGRSLSEAIEEATQWANEAMKTKGQVLKESGQSVVAEDDGSLAKKLQQGFGGKIIQSDEIQVDEIFF